MATARCALLSLAPEAGSPGGGAARFKLRAACDLSRLYTARGDRTEGFAMFAPIYSKFTAGLDTLISRKRRRLMDELA
jgi:hypothetical protein